MKKLWEKIFQYALGAMIVLAFFVVVLMLILHPVEGNSEVLYAMVGVLGSMTLMVASYFYGSSKGSSDKNEMLNNGSNE